MHAQARRSNSPTRTVFVLAVAIAIVGIPAIGTSADLRSGLQVGDAPIPFYVQDVTGPRRGNSLCYACAFGRHAVVNIQTQRLTQPLVKLIQRLDSLVDPAKPIQGDTQHAFVVYLTESPDEAAAELKSIATDHGIANVPLTVYDELTGPPGYNISNDAEVTVMIWSQSKVLFSRAFAPDSLDDKAVESLLMEVKTQLHN